MLPSRVVGGVHVADVAAQVLLVGFCGCPGLIVGALAVPVGDFTVVHDIGEVGPAEGIRPDVRLGNVEAGDDRAGGSPVLDGVPVAASVGNSGHAVKAAVARVTRPNEWCYVGRAHERLPQQVHAVVQVRNVRLVVQLLLLCVHCLVP